jgi:dihydrofolate reductase
MFSLIVAKSKNNVIGKDGEMPWYLPDDLKNFSRLTRGHKVIMGRKTYESILKRLNKPLPDRENIILTSQKNFSAPDCVVCHSISEVLDIVSSAENEEIFIIGGEKVYRDFLPLTEKIYLTEIEAEIEGDSFFPEINNEQWKILTKTVHDKDSKHDLSFAFINLSRLDI